MYTEIQQLINKFSNLHVLVVGDLILDIYLAGNSTRLSPEAPVPVVDVLDEKIFMGGAANVAANVRALGANVFFCSVCGRDEKAEKAIALLRAKSINTNFIVKDPERETLVKERITAHSQILVRFDRGSDNNISEYAEKQLIKQLDEAYAHCDVVILADYDKGIFTPKIIKAIKDLQKKKPVFIAVDSKRLIAFKGLKPDLIKPNYEETMKLLSLKTGQKERIDQIRTRGKELFRLTGAKLTVVTLDEDGAIIFQNGYPVHRTYAIPVARPNVAGAGDTFISVMSLSMAVQKNVEEASELASAAAAIAVKKENTACCSDMELRSFFAHQHKHIVGMQELTEICDIYHAQKRKIVFTNGCFDILHSGHVNYLNRAGKLGDILIVGINTDESIRRLKGTSRPVNPLADRVEVIAALSTVSHIIAFGEEENDTPIELIKCVRPDIFVKGGDYTKAQLPEASVVEKLGGKIQFLPHIPNHSTTHVIRRIHEMAV